jgi:bromodomain-containing factor 1
MTIPQHKAMLNIVRSLKKSKDSTAFLHPVDYIAFGIPHYPQFISKPMDLATVETKLFASNPAGPPKDKSKQGKWDTSKGTYSTVNDVINDVRQIWDNTNIFNGPTHAVSLCAKTLDDMFEKALDRVPRDDVSVEGWDTRH